jgi:hypothetical protein
VIGEALMDDLVLQCLIGLAILLQFNRLSIALGGASLIAVAIYPFMKRFTYWPQIFLGLGRNSAAALVVGNAGCRIRSGPKGAPCFGREIGRDFGTPVSLISQYGRVRRSSSVDTCSSGMKAQPVLKSDDTRMMCGSGACGSF